MSTLALTSPRSIQMAQTRSKAPATRRPQTLLWLWNQRSVVALLGLLAVALGAVVAVLVASLIGPFIMFVAPLILIFGFALGPLHAMIRGDL
jgi:type IV secretory pathway TrbD component